MRSKIGYKLNGFMVLLALLILGASNAHAIGRCTQDSRYPGLRGCLYIIDFTTGEREVDEDRATAQDSIEIQFHNPVMPEGASSTYIRMLIHERGQIREAHEMTAPAFNYNRGHMAVSFNSPLNALFTGRGQGTGIYGLIPSLPAVVGVAASHDLLYVLAKGFFNVELPMPRFFVPAVVRMAEAWPTVRKAVRSILRNGSDVRTTGHELAVLGREANGSRVNFFRRNFNEFMAFLRSGRGNVAKKTGVAVMGGLSYMFAASLIIPPVYNALKSHFFHDMGFDWGLKYKLTLRSSLSFLEACLVSDEGCNRLMQSMHNMGSAIRAAETPGGVERILADDNAPVVQPHGAQAQVSITPIATPQGDAGVAAVGDAGVAAQGDAGVATQGDAATAGDSGARTLPTSPLVDADDFHGYQRLDQSRGFIERRALRVNNLELFKDAFRAFFRPACSDFHNYSTCYRSHGRNTVGFYLPYSNMDAPTEVDVQ